MDTKINGLDIKIARLKAGLRQYDLAARLSIPPSRLSEIESGRRKPVPIITQQALNYRHWRPYLSVDVYQASSKYR